MKIYVAGYQHETNTFAPTKADWASFNRGESFPAFITGQPMLDSLRDVNIPIAGFMEVARFRPRMSHAMRLSVSVNRS